MNVFVCFPPIDPDENTECVCRESIARLRVESTLSFLRAIWLSACRCSFSVQDSGWRKIRLRASARSPVQNLGGSLRLRIPGHVLPHIRHAALPQALKQTAIMGQANQKPLKLRDNFAFSCKTNLESHVRTTVSP